MQALPRQKRRGPPRLRPLLALVGGQIQQARVPEVRWPRRASAGAGAEQGASGLAGVPGCALEVVFRHSREWVQLSQ